MELAQRVARIEEREKSRDDRIERVEMQSEETHNAMLKLKGAAAAMVVLWTVATGLIGLIAAHTWPH